MLTVPSALFVDDSIVGTWNHCVLKSSSEDVGKSGSCSGGFIVEFGICVAVKLVVDLGRSGFMHPSELMSGCYMRWRYEV